MVGVWRGGGTRTVGTTIATGPGSEGLNPSGADLNKMFTKEAFKRLPRKQRVDYLMDRLINEGGSVPTFRRAFFIKKVSLIKKILISSVK